MRILRQVCCWLAVGLVAAGCGVAGGESVIPPDPLGVAERLAAAPDAIGWQACSIAEFGHDLEGSDRRRSAGVFSPSQTDAIAAHQSASQNSGPVQAYAWSGVDLVAHSDGAGPFSRRGWGDPVSLYEVVVSPLELLDPEQAATALGVAHLSPISLTDPAGRSYLHFESLPTTTWDQPGSDELWPAETLLGSPVSTVVYAVDIWEDSEGRTERIRRQTQDLQRRWAELRFTDEAISSNGTPVLPDCPDRLDMSPPDGWNGFQAWDQQLTVPLQVATDPTGRPYDVAPAQSATIRRDQFATVHTSDGTIVVMDGNALEVDMVYFLEGSPVVDFGGATDLDVEVIWEVFPDREDVLGVRLDRPGTAVHHWGSWEYGYLTDGGVGGFTTGAVIAEARRRGDASMSEDLAALTADAYPAPIVADLDGVDGLDTMYFSNGYGDGAYPIARGLDPSGAVVSLFIFDFRYPWRLTIPDGIPPPNVTAREQEYIECRDGIRAVLPDGTCPADEDAFR